MNALTALPPQARAALYLGYTLVGVVVGALQVAYIAAGDGQPTWLTVTLAVVPFLGAGFGLTAASNTPTAVSTPRHALDADNDGVPDIAD